MKKVLFLLPLLILFAAVALLMRTSNFAGDEAGYAQFALNLSNGYYSPPDHVDLWWGPGYPLILLPFVLLKIDWQVAILLNPLFLFGALVYLFYVLCTYTSTRVSVYTTYALGIIFVFSCAVHRLITEPLTMLLICGIIYHFIASNRPDNKKYFHVAITSFYLGYLSLTKVFYGYVITCCLLLAVIAIIVIRGESSKRAAIICLFSLAIASPYLVYTYNVTNKFFYWGNGGGINLYYLSSPYDQELGDWLPYPGDMDGPMDQIYENHHVIFDSISKLDTVQRDDALKRKALENIINYPVKFIFNWTANVSRLIFGFPYSYKSIKPSRAFIRFYLTILPRMFVVAFSIYAIYPAITARTEVSFEIAALFIFAVIAFGGHTMLSAVHRYFLPLIPILTVWIFYTLSYLRPMEKTRSHTK